LGSIKQPPRAPGRLPEFRNLGVWLRACLLATGLALAAAVLLAEEWRGFAEQFSIVVLHVHPPTLLLLAVGTLAAGALSRLPRGAGIVAVLGLGSGSVLASEWLLGLGGGLAPAEPMRAALLGAAGTALALGYFDLRARALSPVIAEARLQALQARIRPHFLFNSINAVLSLIRSQPARAEAALEDMADLFRVLMSDNRDLAPLAAEVALCRQYLDLEHLRLGDRLNVEWHVDHMPGDALVPPLVLQPLVENAVYHGIEPLQTPGTITVNILRRRDEIHMLLRNPCPPGRGGPGGNRMALANIRERLALHFDEEGRLEARTRGDDYEVHIRMPYRPQPVAGGAR
jgi:two-component system sensor histidine kinase AlgZ